MLPMRPVFVALAACTLLPFVSPARAQQTVLPLWPTATPEPAQTTEAEVDVTKPTDPLISGHRSARLTNVTKPTLTVYSPNAKNNTGAAALVFPGGGYVRLAWDGEGLDTCRWLNSVGMTCLLVKYRVPEQGRFPDNPADLEDAQQAMRLARQHADEWHINPNKIGVIGFSAGANLAVLLSTHPDDHHVESTPAASEVNTKIDARANFAVIAYPAYLIPTAASAAPTPPEIEPVYTPNQFTPPTFLIQAENDRAFRRNAIAYYFALSAASIPAELHMYAIGGHGFGLHPVGRPEEHWTQLATAWLRFMKVLPEVMPGTNSNGIANGAIDATPTPCPNMTPPQPGRPATTTPSTLDPTCW